MKRLVTTLAAVAFLSGTALAAETSAPPPPTPPSTTAPGDQKLIEESHKAGPAKKNTKKTAKKGKAKAKSDMSSAPASK